MSWNYRIVRRKGRDYLGHDEYYLALHAVYYDSAGKPNGMSENPTTFGADEEEGVDEIISSLELALKSAREKPILDEADVGVKDE